ncbi:MAG TPA: aminotransferase class I/II-fold pyridoxal phosphate-dependent enzyme, partial [Chitinophagaceae bacterium]|nr:aminotransferase class I/II-fold pyridoxal phosphate-dependent enzyme [Chitinophagaceae bacterium]
GSARTAPCRRRFGNPTIEEAERKIALLEAYGLKDANGEALQLYAILHASGMAALTTMLLSNLKAGDKVITHPSLYGGTQEMLEKILPGLGVEHLILDMKDEAAVSRALEADSSIRMMYLETPANPTLQCVDLKSLSALARKQGLVVCVDNTFSTPLLQQPFAYDVDFVMHSTTKFLNGHGTAVGGVLVGRDAGRMNTDVKKMHRLLGGNSNAFEAFLLNNGMKTLPLRMERHCSNAMQVAQFLEQQAGVSRVNYPGLASHPDHGLAATQMKSFGSVISIELAGGFDAAVTFMNKLKVCTNAVSLGTCDTLVSHPASTTHYGVSREQRIASGISDGLIRISIGLETVSDLIADFEQALQ